MFRNITINLNGPICKCYEQELSWSIMPSGTGQYGLSIECKTCKIRLEIPHKEFKAGFKLDVSYPGKPKNTKPSTDLTVIDGGKVINIEDHKPDSENSQS